MSSLYESIVNEHHDAAHKWVENVFYDKDAKPIMRRVKSPCGKYNYFVFPSLPETKKMLGTFEPDAWNGMYWANSDKKVILVKIGDDYYRTMEETSLKRPHEQCQNPISPPPIQVISPQVGIHESKSSEPSICEKQTHKSSETIEVLQSSIDNTQRSNDDLCAVNITRYTIVCDGKVSTIMERQQSVMHPKKFIYTVSDLSLIHI